MSEPQKPEDNPYVATQVADIATTAGDRRAPGPVAILFAVVLGAATAIVTFCLTFFFTCLGLPNVAPSFDSTVLVIVFGIAIATTIAVTWFAVWGFLKLVSAVKSGTNRGNTP